MYKSKLQELCHRRQWGSPEYTAIKKGPDHNPRFQATVTVNDLSFTTEKLCKLSKEAQNDAARMAFEHFSSSLQEPASIGPEAPSSSRGSSGIYTTVGVVPQETDATHQLNSCTSASSNDVNVSRDMENMYKNQLQNYIQKKNLALPIYSCERMGPPHACRFRCKVNVDGKIFEDLEFHSTVKEAEHATARIALMSLLPDGAQKDDSPIYKNLLQQWTQKQDLGLPIYGTIQSGETHEPTFVSTVEVAGKAFSGQEAKSKKQAEMNAAKVAYLTLKENSGKSNESPKILSVASQKQAQNSTFGHESKIFPDLNQIVSPMKQIACNPSFIPPSPAEEGKVNDEPRDSCCFDEFPQPDFITTSGNQSSSDVPSSFQPENTPSSSSFPPALNLALDTPSGVDASYIRVQVFPQSEIETAPEDYMVLCESDDWIAFRLTESVAN